ncbi:exodeoxyribonuclease VII small subunit [Marinobacteraceae bacterium S3BR75-40.1]
MTEEKNPQSLADFETSLEELESLVRKLEQGELSLEDSLAAFEKGVRLTRSCQQALKSAEQRVQKVVEQENGEFDVTPFKDEGADGE